MKTAISHQIQQAQRQTQKISARQIQALQILRLDREALREEMEEEYQKNPFLDYAPPAWESGSSAAAVSGAEQDADFTAYTAAPVTFRDQLAEQLSWLHLSDRQTKLCRFLLGLLDDNGYLTDDLSETAETVHIPESELQDALHVVRSLDPPGIGAACMEECLELQLRAKGKLTPVLQKMIRSQMNRIAARDYAAISENLLITPEEAQKYAEQIRRLDPLPVKTLSAASEATPFIIPDLRAEIVDGEIVLTYLDEYDPQIHLSRNYQNILENSEPESELHQYLTGCRDSAQQFLLAVRRRRGTIMNIAGAITDRQKAFLLHGPEYLMPMTQTEIADAAGVSDSTVSRTVNGKYIDCPRGIFELKDFFSSGIIKQDGSAVSSRVILQKIKDLVCGESAEKPLSDREIAEILNREGIPAARRTVAKYRAECRIPPASDRKR